MERLGLKKEEGDKKDEVYVQWRRYSEVRRNLEEQVMMEKIHEWQMNRLRRKLNAPGRFTRVEAAEKLFRKGDRSGYNILIEALEYDGICCTAAGVFADFGVRDAIPKIVEKLLNTAYGIDATLLMRAMQQFGGQEAVEALTSLLTRNSDEFEKFENGVVGVAILPKSDFSGDSIRFDAAEYLGESGDLSAVEPLKRVVEDMSNSLSVRGAAARALERLRGEQEV